MTTRTHFADALDALRVHVDVLGALAEEAVRHASAALIGDLKELADGVVAGDDRLDRMFVNLEERSYEIIAQQAPVASDLRVVMSALRVASDFEKVGDRAVAIAKIVSAQWEREGETLTSLGRLADLALGMLTDARRAWVEQDLEVARSLKERDDVLDAGYRQLTRHLLDLRLPDVNRLVLYAHSAGRHLERIADHAVIVGDRVDYLLTGDVGSLASEVR